MKDYKTLKLQFTSNSKTVKVNGIDSKWNVKVDGMGAFDRYDFVKFRDRPNCIRKTLQSGVDMKNAIGIHKFLL